MKVYCINCLYLRKPIEEDNIYRCIVGHYVNNWLCERVKVDDPAKINKDNDCVLYKTQRIKRT